MKKSTFYTGLLLSASILLSACQQKSPVIVESSSQETTTAEDPVPTNLAEGTIQEVSTATEAAEMPYTLSDSAKGQLTGILTNTFFFDIGHDQEQKFSDLTFENSNLGILLYTTLFDVEGAQYDQHEPSRIHVSKDKVKTYLRDCFGIDLDSLNIDSTFLEEDGDDYAIVANDPFGSDIPDCQINTVTQNTTTGIITLTGDVWYVPIDSPARFSTFTATMIPSDSSCFDGHTLLTFEWHENHTDNHPTINYADYGFWEGYNPETTAAQ